MYNARPTAELGHGYVDNSCRFDRDCGIMYTTASTSQQTLQRAASKGHTGRTSAVLCCRQCAWFVCTPLIVGCRYISTAWGDTQQRRSFFFSHIQQRLSKPYHCWSRSLLRSGHNSSTAVELVAITLKPARGLLDFA